MTKPERITKQLLESIGFNVKPFKSRSYIDTKNTFYTETPFKNKRLDFALIGQKIAIEVNGDYWHGTCQNQINSNQLKRKISDAEKKSILEEEGWFLLVISECVLSNSQKWRENIQSWILGSIDL